MNDNLGADKTLHRGLIKKYFNTSHLTLEIFSDRYPGNRHKYFEKLRLEMSVSFPVYHLKTVT